MDGTLWKSTDGQYLSLAAGETNYRNGTTKSSYDLLSLLDIQLNINPNQLHANSQVKSPLGDNLVLIKMASPVIFSDFARHICLPEESEGGMRIGMPPWGLRLSKICVRLGWNKQGIHVKLENII